jgi:catechol 2,3-dioxygenase-like lactoylglutathione lyase family enzyme
MLTFPGLRHHQIAYITTDMDEALRRLEKAFGLDRYFFIDTLAQPSYPEQPGLKIALVRTAGTEFEVIQPLGYKDELWSDPLPRTGEFALLFHHIAVTVDGPISEYDRYRAGIDETLHPVVTEGWGGEDARWFYTDERATLGHFVEHCWFSPGLTGYMAASVPVLPVAHS